MKKNVWYLVGILSIGCFLPTMVHTITLSPLRQTFVLEPGQTDITSITVTNESEETITILPEIDAYTIDDTTGQAIFGKEDIAIDWIEPTQQNITITSNEEKDIPFRINVPANARPGAHYLALFARQQAGEGLVGIGSRGGSLLFLYVGGEIEESLVRNNFSTKKQWYIAPAIDIQTILQNTGSIHVIPRGEIRITNKKNNHIATLPINPEDRKILPDSTWQQDDIVQNLSWKDAGKIQIEMALQYGLTNKIIVDRVSVWYIPKGIILLSLGEMLELIITSTAAAIVRKK